MAQVSTAVPGNPGRRAREEQDGGESAYKHCLGGIERIKRRIKAIKLPEKGRWSCVSLGQESVVVRQQKVSKPGNCVK